MGFHCKEAAKWVTFFLIPVTTAAQLKEKIQVLCLEFLTTDVFSLVQCPDPMDLKSAVGTQWKSSLTCLLSPSLTFLISGSCPHVPGTYDFGYSDSTILCLLTGNLPDKWQLGMPKFLWCASPSPSFLVSL